jgi:hypothetical protein
MKIIKTLTVVLVISLCLFGVIGACDKPDNSETNSVTSITLKYNNSAIPGDSITVDLSVGTLTFTADVETIGAASKDFKLSSSKIGIVAISDKTVTLLSEGETTITGTAVGDKTKTHAIKLIIEDNRVGPREYNIYVTGGTSDKETAFPDETVTLTPIIPDGKVFTDWTITPPVTMLSENSFIMPSANVSVTGNFENESPVGPTAPKPYYITNNFGEDSSSELLVQWHNDSDVITQTLQIVMGADDFSNAQTITVTGTKFEGSTNLGSFEARNVFRAHVTDLSPKTQYKYRVGDKGAWSETYYHLTSSGNTDNFNFTVVSDPQSGAHAEMKATLTAADTFDPDSRFYLIGGDIVDQIGKTPSEIISYTNTAAFFNKYRPIAATQGNHDTYYVIGSNNNDNEYRFGESTVFNAFVTFPDNGWDTHADKANRSQSYYFYYNKVLFIILNTMATGNNAGTAEPNHTKQAAWLKQILENDKANNLSRYRIVLTHVSIISARQGDPNRWLTPGVRSAYGKICTDYNVDIFFAGHDHVYTRSNPIKIGTDTNLANMTFTATDKGTVFSIVSATGPKFYSFENKVAQISQYFPVALEEPKTGVFINVKVTADKLIVKAMALPVSGTVLEQLDTYEVTAK